MATDDNAEITLAIYSIVGKIKTLIKKLSTVKFKHCSNQGATLFNADTPMSSPTSYHWYHVLCTSLSDQLHTYGVQCTIHLYVYTTEQRSLLFFYVLRGSGPTLIRETNQPLWGIKEPIITGDC